LRLIPSAEGRDGNGLPYIFITTGKTMASPTPGNPNNRGITNVKALIFSAQPKGAQAALNPM